MAEDADVIVIGAGAAGLNAARILSAQSHRILVLEARDRVGGRVFPQNVAGLETAVELGAEFIHGSAAETLELLHAAGAGPQPTADESWIYANGALQPDEDDFFSSASIFERAHDLESDESVDAFLKRFAADPKMRATVTAARSFVEGFDAADPAIASVRGIAAEWESGTDSASARPRGGYGAMLVYLRDTCEAAGVDLRLSTEVRRIAWRRGHVAVEVRDRTGAVQTLQARTAIVTVPVGVLQDDNAIAFEPRLPPSKTEALRFIVSGHVVKVAMWFSSAFWECVDGGKYRDAGFFRREGRPFMAYWTQIPLRARLINAWAGGPRAEALRGVAQNELIDAAVEGFGELFGDAGTAHRVLAGAALHDWGRDPFACGAYSYVTVGGTGARGRLAQPVDATLFFAGEATSTNGQGGTVNGALITGVRAAAEAAAALSAKSGR